jgi:hypothetical protein
LKIIHTRPWYGSIVIAIVCLIDYIFRITLRIINSFRQVDIGYKSSNTDKHNSRGSNKEGKDHDFKATHPIGIGVDLIATAPK